MYLRSYRFNPGSTDRWNMHPQNPWCTADNCLPRRSLYIEVPVQWATIDAMLISEVTPRALGCVQRVLGLRGHPWCRSEGLLYPYPFQKRVILWLDAFNSSDDDRVKCVESEVWLTEEMVACASQGGLSPASDLQRTNLSALQPRIISIIEPFWDSLMYRLCSFGN